MYPTSKDNNDQFMKKFKYYKSNNPKPSLQKVLSIEKDYSTDLIKSINNNNIEKDERVYFLGLQELQHWKTYTFHSHPGLYLIKNPFTSLGQRYWIRKCLEEYPRRPNKMNLDIEVSLQDWWATCYEDGECDRKLLKKLRWTTLGYHHNWDTKVYSEENRTPFPEDLAELTDVVARYLGYNNFRAEAAIVNYYHMNSTLSAHTDHSEVNLEAPLFSFSFGQSAIFMIGGENKSIEPSAVMLNSGDIMIMSKQARVCYHAVPKILPSTSTPWNNQEELMMINNDSITFKYITNHKQLVTNINKNICEKEWSKFKKYIEESRINMNVRQVLNEKQKCLRDSNFIDT